MNSIHEYRVVKVVVKMSVFCFKLNKLEVLVSIFQKTSPISICFPAFLNNEFALRITCSVGDLRVGGLIIRGEDQDVLK